MGWPFALRAGVGDFSRDVMMKVPQPPIGDVRGHEARLPMIVGSSFNPTVDVIRAVR
jgi:hypothetical protein